MSSHASRSRSPVAKHKIAKKISRQARQVRRPRSARRDTRQASSATYQSTGKNARVPISAWFSGPPQRNTCHSP